MMGSILSGMDTGIANETAQKMIRNSSSTPIALSNHTIFLNHFQSRRRSFSCTVFLTMNTLFNHYKKRSYFLIFFPSF